MACTSGCATQDHASYGECLKSKNTRVAWCQSAKGLDLTREKNNESELAAYRAARAQGIQPAGTTRARINEAVEISQITGRAYNAEKPMESMGLV